MLHATIYIVAQRTKKVGFPSTDDPVIFDSSTHQGQIILYYIIGTCTISFFKKINSFIFICKFLVHIQIDL